MSYISECPGREEYSKVILSAAYQGPDAGFLRGERVLITGATGMLGSALARTLLYLNRSLDLGIKLLLPVRDEGRAREALQGVWGRDDAEVFTCDLNRPVEIDGPVSFIVHAASPTASREFVEHPAGVLTGMLTQQMNLLSFAKSRNVHRYVYLSSMEVYGVQQGVVSEADLGYVDPASVRSCYPEGKRACELMCLCYAREHSLPACSARLAQTFGAGARPGDSRAFSQFAKSALKGEDIVLKTAGASMGNYVHLADAVSALMYLMALGLPGESYNVCGDRCHARIRELALLISRTLSGGKSQVRCLGESPDALPYAPDTSFIMNNSKLRSLGWQPRFGLEDMALSLGRGLQEAENIQSPLV